MDFSEAWVMGADEQSGKIQLRLDLFPDRNIGRGSSFPLHYGSLRSSPFHSQTFPCLSEELLKKGAFTGLPFIRRKGGTGVYPVSVPLFRSEKSGITGPPEQLFHNTGL